MASNLFRAIAGVWTEEEWVLIRGSEGSKSIQSHSWSVDSGRVGVDQRK